MAPARSTSTKPRQVHNNKAAAGAQAVPFPTASVAAILEAVVGGPASGLAAAALLTEAPPGALSSVTVQEVKDDGGPRVATRGSRGPRLEDDEEVEQGDEGELGGSVVLSEDGADVADGLSEDEDEDDDEDEDEDGERSSQVDLVNHMYELFTSTQGVNVTEALLQIKESLDKTNKILFKILAVAGQPIAAARQH